MNWNRIVWSEIMGRGDAVDPMPLDLGVEDADETAELHSQVFDHGWSSEEFAALLGQAGVFGYALRRAGAPNGALIGFVLARLTLDEAEILTLAVAPSARGRGFGRRLMDRVLERLHGERAASLFLEVEESNRPAVALYRRLRFAEVGRRPAYYRDAQGRPANALVMKRSFAPG